MTEQEVEETLPEDFTSFGLDARLIRALRKMGITSPTVVQSQAIPLLLEGENIVLCARTGSGKTLAFLLPLFDLLLSRSVEGTVVIVEPTAELAYQCWEVAQETLKYAPLKAIALTKDLTTDQQTSLLLTRPDLVISTIDPFRRFLDQDPTVAAVVLDEADLLVSMGESVLAGLVARCESQVALISATIDGTVEQFARVHIERAVRVKVREEAGVVQLMRIDLPSIASDEARFLFLCAAFRLKLLSGRTLVFVNDVDRALRVSLFLYKFGISHFVVYDDMPGRHRRDVLSEFNKGRAKILVLTDKGLRSLRAEAGSERGIDFVSVVTVLNLDAPRTVSNAVHRAGRTGRAGLEGMVVTLADSDELRRMSQWTVAAESSLEDYIGEAHEFDWERVEKLRYRVRDVAHQCSSRAVSEYKRHLIREGLKGSAVAQAAVEEGDADVLEGLSKSMSLMRRENYLRRFPDYLLSGNPAAVIAQTSSEIDRKARRALNKQLQKRRQAREAKRKFKRKRDPLARRRKR